MRAPSDGLRGFWEEFDAHYEAGGFFMLIVHPFLTGRLARWRQVEKLLAYMREKGDVWFAPMDEIARHVRRVIDDGSYRPKIDRHPHYRERVSVVKERTNGATPILATILVGDDPASATYVKMKGNACRRVGMDSRQHVMG